MFVSVHAHLLIYCESGTAVNVRQATHLFQVLTRMVRRQQSVAR